MQKLFHSTSEYIFVSMKFLCHLFSLYFLWLTVQPCTDYKEVESAGNYAENSTHKDDCCDDNSELCSPFCYCSCCCTNVVINHTTESFLALSDIYKPSPSIAISDEKEVFLAIWQPPKIS